jgi:small subunit ribosomal protein S16
MLSIRMQRTGRKGHAMFRVVVQESRLTPTSGKVVALLGSYDPHAKVATLDKEKAAFYLSNGAQPSDRTVRLLQSEGIKMPSWVKVSEGKAGKLRNPEKLRRNQPKEEKPAAEAAPAAEKAEEKAPEAE